MNFRLALPCLLFVLFLASPVFASQEQKPDESNEKKPASAPQSSFTVKTKLLEIKHRGAEELANVLRGLCGTNGSVSANEEFRTLTVRYYP